MSIQTQELTQIPPQHEHSIPEETTENEPSITQDDAARVLGPETLKMLYSSLLKCRMVIEQAQKLSRRSAVIKGREAVRVGGIIDLTAKDSLAVVPGDWGAGYLKGMPLSEIFTLARPTRAGSGKQAQPPATGNRMSSNVVMPPAGTAFQLHVATGMALDCKLRKTPAATVVIAIGDKQSRSAWQETLSFAAMEKLPMLFLAQTVEPARPARASGKGPNDLASLALACGMPGMPLDGNDVVAIYRVAFEALRRARDGQGPALLECKFFPPAALPHKPMRDPLAFMQNYLEQKKIWSAEWKKQLAAEFKSELERAEQSGDQAAR